MATVAAALVFIAARLAAGKHPCPCGLAYPYAVKDGLTFAVTGVVIAALIGLTANSIHAFAGFTLSIISAGLIGHYAP